jgi:hypothetical protein
MTEKIGSNNSAPLNNDIIVDIYLNVVSRARDK